MNDTLKQLQAMIEAIDSPEHIDESLAGGDYALLCVDRMVVQEHAQSGKLSDDELALVDELDAHVKSYITEVQLLELIEWEPDMPIKAWWGNAK